MRIYSNSNISEYLHCFFERRKSLNDEIKEKVNKIITDVRLNGDGAVKKYTSLFDNVDLECLEVSKDEIKEANISSVLLTALNKAAENIRTFHEREKEKSWSIKREDGSHFGIRVNAIEKVGVYVPGGSAPLPSSVLMNIIPAKVAGVKEIIMCTPPQKDGKINPVILKAAELAGVDRIFKIGGAQAISALAYGTETVPKVYKITGPGNAYVAAAKNLVYGDVGIDMIAGPSEILICADENSNSKYIAADLLSQAEHDKMAASILITTSDKLATEVQKQIDIQIEDLQRKDIALESINRNGAIIVVDNIDRMVQLSNLIAPEHLELLFDNITENFISLFKNAGAIFIGDSSPEPMGDYFCGSNHVLPTGGTATFSSPLGVWDFIKRTSIISYTKDGFSKDAKYAYDLAMAEGLTAHANSIKKRCDNE